MSGERRLRGGAVFDTDGVRGFVVDPSDLGRRFVVELFLDGLPAGLARAEAFAPECGSLGDGRYGFGFALPAALADGVGVEVRLANTGERIGDVLRHRDSPPADRGRVAWVGGLRLAGTLPMRAADDEIRAIVDGAVVARGRPTAWAFEQRGALSVPVPAFDLQLPARLADGRVHGVAVVDADGEALAGSPCAVLAFPDGLRAFLDKQAETSGEDARAAWLDRLLPQSLPFTALHAWEARFPPPTPAETASPVRVGVVLVGGDAEGSLPSLRLQRGAAWTAAELPGLGSGARFAAADLERFLRIDVPAGAPVVFALSGTRFRPEALARLALALAAAPEAPLAYSDVELGQPEAPAPLLWPAYDPERQLEQGYAAFLFAGRSAEVLAAARRGADSLPALVLDLAGERHEGAAAPLHVPEILAALPPLRPVPLGDALAQAARRGAEAATVEAIPSPQLPAIRYRRAAPALGITVVVVARPGQNLEAAALERLRADLGPGAYDCIAVGPGPIGPARGWRTLTIAEGRNPSRLRNAAGRAASGEAILFLDAGHRVLDRDWAVEMGDRLAAPTVVAVAPLVCDPDGIAIEAGLVLGPDFAAEAAFAGSRPPQAGFGDGLRVARSCGALGTGCLMIRREAFGAAGGFDELRFPEVYAGADLSLRLRAAGGRLIVTPHARFVREAPPSLLPAAARDDERTRFRDRWGSDLLDDPFYHPALNLDGQPFTGLAWPPRERYPRQPGRPRGLGPAPDLRKDPFA